MSLVLLTHDNPIVNNLAYVSTTAYMRTNKVLGMNHLIFSGGGGGEVWDLFENMVCLPAGVKNKMPLTNLKIKSLFFIHRICSKTLFPGSHKSLQIT